jgi:hypothetical protein
MSKYRVIRPSPALVISVLALIVALGGTSYAAFRLPAGSVHTKQLAAGAVSTAKIKNGAVTGSKVAKNSLTGANINVGTLGTVPSATNASHAATAGSSTAAANATNASHATTADNATNASHATTADNATTAAAASALGSVAYRFDTSAGAVDVPACADNPCTADKVGTSSAIASCPLGMVAIGGGGESFDAGVELSGSFPLTFAFAGQTEPNAWQVDVDNWLQTTSKVDYYVVCAAAKTVDNPSGI